MTLPDSFVRREEWIYRNEADGFTAEFAVLPGRVLYSAFHGYARTKDLIPMEAILESIMVSGLLEEPTFVRIADYTRSRGGGSWHVRVRYPQILNELYDRFKRYPEVTYICGASGALKPMMLFASLVLRQNLVFTETVEEAFAAMESGVAPAAAPQDDEETITIRKGDVSALIRELGAVSFQMPGISAMPSKDHPLNPIYLAIDVLRSDMMHQTAELTARYYELNQTRQALERKGGELEILADNMETQVWYLQKPGVYGAVNLAHASFLGKDRDRIAHKPQAQVLEADQYEAWTQDDTEIFARGQPLQREALLRNNQWEDRLLRIIKTPKLSPKGWVEYVVCSATDITEERQTQLRLEEARRAAEAASMAKRDFLANMSHELRTPLNGVIGITDILLRMGANDEQRYYLSLLGKEANALLGLINDVLDFSKIEAGKMELEVAIFELRPLVEDVARSMAVRATAAGIGLVCYVDPRLTHQVVGDPTRLRQVLVNLLGNAIKFTACGHVSIRVEPETGHADAAIRFTVTDTGIGIPKERQAAVFESFVQADTSTTRRFGGTGLGGSISLALVRLMGGELHLESEMGKGTSVGFTLPLTPVDDEVAPLSTCLATVKGKRVLIIDACRPQREGLADYMEWLGFQPAVAHDAESALEAWREAAPDAALVDEAFPQLLTALATQGIPSAQLYNASAMHPVETPLPAGVEQLAKPLCLMETAKLVSGLFGLGSHKHTRDETQAEEKLLTGRVLLADDYPTNRQVALHGLKRLGLEAQAVENGAQAVEAYERGQFDLILMDLQMPVMDGFAATRAIRAIETSRGKTHLPIIALSASATEDQRRRAKDAGMDDYLTKPFRPHELDAVLGRWLAPGEEAPVPVQEEVSAPTEPIDMDDYVESIGDREAALEILNEFLAGAPAELQALCDAQKAGQLAEVARLAHRFKGGAANLSARPLSAVAAQLEKDARAEHDDVLAEGVDTLARELDNLIRFCRDQT